MVLTDEYLNENRSTINWHEISDNSFFANEDNIRRWKDMVNWGDISACQILSELFIREFQDKVKWDIISSYQVLSEPFIREFKDMVDWFWISRCQVLSEKFISEFKDKVHWYNISLCQVLSEKFIWEFKDMVDWALISSCQNLTPEFRKEFKLPDITPEPSREEKIEAMSSYAKQWNLKFDGEFLFAYREHDIWGRGAWNKTIIYSPGNYYQDWHCDYDSKVFNSFGLGIWPKGNTPVKVSIDDFGIVVNRNDGKCRVKGFAILK